VTFLQRSIVVVKSLSDNFPTPAGSKCQFLNFQPHVLLRRTRNQSLLKAYNCAGFDDSCVVDEAMIPSRVMCVFHRDLSSKNAEKRGAATC
jgi:hypothetical protein